MKKLFLSALLFVFVAVLSTASLRAGDLENLSGKWTVKKTRAGGQPCQQWLEIKKNKFVFKITDADGSVSLYAEGDVKLDRAGALKIVTFTNIQGGDSKENIQPVDDDRQCVYTLSDEAFTLAINFDKERKEKPGVDVYTKAP